MNFNWSGRLILIFFFLIMIVGFFVWVGGQFLFWLFLQVIGIPTNLWSMIEALSTAIAAAAVFSAGFIAYRELSEIADSRHIDIADKLFEELNSDENIKARRWVFQHLPDDPQEGLKSIMEDDRRALKQVLNSLDRVAFLTQSGWIPDDVIMPWMHPMIAKSWDKLEPYVLYERERREEPYYYEHASKLAERCRTWRKTNLADVQVVWVDDAL